MPAPRVLYSATFFVLLMALLIMARPSLIFRPDGTLRRFGVTGTDGEADARDPPTLSSLAVVTVAAAVISAFTFTLIDVISGASVS